MNISLFGPYRTAFMIIPSFLALTIELPLTFEYQLELASKMWSISTETLVALFGLVGTAVIAWLVPSIADWFIKRRQSKYLRKYLMMILYIVYLVRRQPAIFY
jgi:hypothetical protein